MSAMGPIKKLQSPRPTRELEVDVRQSQPGGDRQKRVVTDLITFAAIPSLLFWAMVIMVFQGNLAGAAQLICVALSAGYVGWSAR